MSRRKRLTLDEEREMLAEFRRIVERWRDLPEDDHGQLVESLEDRLGVAHADQIRAAVDETTLRFRELADSTLLDETKSRWSDLAAMLIAATFRCALGSRCEHVADGDRPLFALPAARVIACDRCLPRFRGAIAASDQRNRSGIDRLCDFCLQEPDDLQFVQTTIPYGPALVMGDMCKGCYDQAKSEEVEAA